MPIKRILLLDAVTCALMGLVLAIAAAPLSALLSLPESLLWFAGVLLLPIALFMSALSIQARPSTLGIWLVVLGNWAWVIASIVVLFATGANVLGAGFVLLQAIVVAAFAAMEQRSVRGNSIAAA